MNHGIQVRLLPLPLLFLMSHAVLAAAPVARSGELDLSGISATDPIRLAGEWEHHWLQLLDPISPATVKPLKEQSFMRLPGVWSGPGYATLRLKIRTGKPRSRWQLNIPDLSQAYRLYANGQLIAQNGVVGKNAEEEKPEWRPTTAFVNTVTGDIELTLLTSNFHHRVGGAWYPIEMRAASPGESAVDFISSGTLISIAISVLLAALALQSLLLYAFGQRNTAQIYFALLCVIFAFRALLVGDRFIAQQWPGASWIALVRLEYVTFYAALPIVLEYMIALFALPVSKYVRGLFLATSVSFSIITLFTPATIFSHLLPSYQLLTFLFLGYLTNYIFHAIKENLQGSRLFALGALIAGGATINDLAHAAGWINTLDALPYAWLVFMLIQNSILAKMQTRAFSQLRELSVSLENAVEERTRSYKEEKLRAEEANRVKEQFLSSMSHEIRTPLNGVLGSLQLLEAMSLPEKSLPMLRILRSSVDNLLNIVNNILDLAQLSAHSPAINAVDFDAWQMIEALKNTHTSHAAAKGLSFNIETSPHLPRFLYGDGTKLRQILNNLISNAIKFTPSGSVSAQFLYVIGEDQTVQIQFRVSDTGIGIEKSDMANLFEPFMRLSRKSRPAQDGAGIGLAITKRLIDAMGGTIRIESNKDRGSSFIVAIPLVAQSTNLGSMMIEESLRRCKKILVVEDNEVNAIVAREIITKLGHSVDVAENGVEALEHCLKKKYDLIFMDIQMPRMDGVAATEEIRRRPDNSQKTPIIALTANVFPEDELRYLKAGMNAVLAKPISLKEIEQTIARYAA